MVALLTPDDVAAQLQVGVKTLANWRSSGQGPAFVKLPGAVRYRPEVVDAWVASLEPKSNVTPIQAARSA